VPADLTIPAAETFTPGTLRPSGFIAIHPRHRAWLTGCGIATAADALDLPGEIVCGHPDRHVVRVELATALGRRVAFLKREHVVGWRVRLRNTLSGFGWVSRSEREAKCLRDLERLGLAGPQWLAYGEDGTGRAFLLVDGLSGHVELRELLSDSATTAGDRRELAERLGRAVADLHDAGFDTPDLSAKHIFVHTHSLRASIIDWQSARRRAAVPNRNRVRALATLAASFSQGLATPRDRLRVLWAYRRAVPWVGGRPGFAEFVRTIRAAADPLARRSSIREQQVIGAAANSQKLVWLAGMEAVCVRPDMVADWPSPAVCPPFYPSAGEVIASGERNKLSHPGRQDSTMIRYRSVAFPRLIERLTGRLWRSPAAAHARTFFHLERRGVLVPRLLAFGQRRSGRIHGESFVLHEKNTNAIPVGNYLSGERTLADRRRVVFAIGAAMRTLHDAGCRFDRSADSSGVVHVVTDAGSIPVRFDPTAGIRKVRRVSRVARFRDLRMVIASLPSSAGISDSLRVLSGYFAGDHAARTEVRATARRILGGRAA
jgi:hypothetical protein